MTLDHYLGGAKVPGISDVDTRAITQILRDEGSQRAVIFPIDDADPAKVEKIAKLKIQEIPKMEGLELVSEVSCKTPYWFETQEGGSEKNGTIVAYDFGVKKNILRYFSKHDFRVRVVPHNFSAADVRKERPRAIVLSNGPGDPAEVKDTVKEIQSMIGEIPIFAVCMGHQLLARAVGASTYKLKFGHHGCNHPVQDLRTKRVLITSQNHGFSVKTEELKGDGLQCTHISLNDRTCEGFASPKLKLASVQFHPEAAPGPHEAGHLFEDFIRGHIQ
jgi:carbamoyl-phosphate synthase small subunit